MVKEHKVMVVVLNYNGIQINEACLASLEAEGTPDVQVLFVDNGSTDGSYEKARKAFPDFSYQQNGQNLFFAAGNNRGLETALARDAEYAFILNNDTVVEPGCVGKLLKFMETHAEAAACQPVLCQLDRPQIIASGGCRLGGIGKAWDHACGCPVAKLSQEPFPVLGVTGGAMFVRASVLKSVGMFDESFKMYFEDVDLSLRMRNAGWELYCIPDARVLHKMSATTKARGMSWRTYFCERNSYRVMLKNFPPGRLVRGYARGLLFAAMASASSLLTGRFLNGWYILKAMLQGGLDGVSSFPRVWREKDRLCRFEDMVDWKVNYPHIAANSKTAESVSDVDSVESS